MSFQAIELTPGMSYDALVQSLNENFTIIENETDLYKDTGTYTFPETSVASGVSENQVFNVVHTVGGVPRFDAFVTADGRATAGGGIIAPFPSGKIVVPIHNGMANATDNFAINYFLGADGGTMYILRRITNITGSTQTAPPDEITYYLHREKIE